MIILDTNVLSELMRPAPNPKVVAWISKSPPHQLFTTSITEAEIFYGIELLARGKRREELLDAATAMFAEDLGGQVLPFDSDAAHAFASIASRRRRLSMPINHADAQIAAIALSRKAKLATHNLADFQSCGIDLSDPWIDS